MEFLWLAGSCVFRNRLLFSRKLEENSEKSGKSRSPPRVEFPWNPVESRGIPWNSTARFSCVSFWSESGFLRMFLVWSWCPAYPGWFPAYPPMELHGAVDVLRCSVCCCGCVCVLRVALVRSRAQVVLATVVLLVFALMPRGAGARSHTLTSKLRANKCRVYLFCVLGREI